MSNHRCKIDTITPSYELTTQDGDPQIVGADAIMGVAGELTTIGMAQHVWQVCNQETAFGDHVEVGGRVLVPRGTKLIFPSVHSWTVGFGEWRNSGVKQPQEVGDSHNVIVPFHRESAARWSQNRSHSLGLAHVSLVVDRISQPTVTDYKNGTPVINQFAELSLSLYLNDDDRDKPWFGSIIFSLLFFGAKNLVPVTDYLNPGGSEG